MEKVTVYFIFTDTGTNLSRIINLFTKQSLNHVSIGFDEELEQVYSFGRKNPKNPFSGGFVKEDIRSDFLKDANCAVYTFKVTETERQSIMKNIKEIEANKQSYRYNFIGLIGILLQIEIRRKYAFFCSEFVAEVLSDTDSLNIPKPHCFTTPTDIRSLVGMQLIYVGKLGEYRLENEKSKEETMKQLKKPQRLAFIFSISRRVKQFVIR